MLVFLMLWQLNKGLANKMILIKNRQRSIHIDIKKLESCAMKMLKVAGYPDFDLGLLITTDKSIRQYNNQFRSKDKATDILSFPFYPELKAGQKIIALSEDEKNLGDIIISAAFVQNKAIDYGRSFEQHLSALLAHGIAHLLGHDHIDDADFVKMDRFEKKLIKSIASD